MQTGMQLRGRQLPGAVHAIPQHAAPARQEVTRSPSSPGQRVLGLFGTLRRKLTDAFSEVMTTLDETSYEQVSMDETMAVVPETPRPTAFGGTTPSPISNPAASPTLHMPTLTDEHATSTPYNGPTLTMPQLTGYSPNPIDNIVISTTVPTTSIILHPPTPLVTTSAAGTQVVQTTLTGLLPAAGPVTTAVSAPHLSTPATSTTLGPIMTGLLPAAGPGTVGLSPPTQTLPRPRTATNVNYSPPANPPSGLRPPESVASPAVVNHYSNCSFGTSSSVPLTSPKVPIFDDKMVDIETYMANFRAMTVRSTAEEKLNLLRSKLTGKAARILAALDLQGVPLTFESLVAELERSYVGERSEWVAKLRDVRREDGESLDDLAFRISLYSRRAYGNLQPDLGLQLYLSLREGPLGDKLFEVKDQPLPEVLRKAKSYESHLLSVNQPVFSQQAVAAVYPPSESRPWDNNRAQDDFARGRRPPGRGRGEPAARGRGTVMRGRGQLRYNSQDRRFPTDIRRCFVCRSPEHLWQDCPRAAAHFSPSEGATGSPDSGRFALNH